MNSHLSDIDSVINFLIKYKSLLKNYENEEIKIANSNKLSILLNYSSTQMNGYIESLYSILDLHKNINLDNETTLILEEQKQINENINEILPLILFYFANKTSSPCDRELHVRL
tara:strand:+ start:1610 stop:1951 length:342 start_codon:yes stop_codon:yes gene_type:complete